MSRGSLDNGKEEVGYSENAKYDALDLSCLNCVYSASAISESPDLEVCWFNGVGLEAKRSQNQGFEISVRQLLAAEEFGTVLTLKPSTLRPQTLNP